MKNNKSTFGLKGEKANAWKGGRVVRGRDILIYMPAHPQATNKRYVTEQRIKVEAALGRILPPRSVIHHIDLNSHNNANSNLVLCEDQSYHTLIHRRARALRACGNAEWLKCPICKKYDSPENMYVCYKDDGTPKFGRHRECHAKNMIRLKKLKGL